MFADPEALKGIKRGKARQMGKTPKGKKRKTQKSETGGYQSVLREYIPESLTISVFSSLCRN